MRNLSVRRFRLRGPASAAALVLVSGSALSAFQTVKPTYVPPPPRVVVPRTTTTPVPRTTTSPMNTGSVGRGTPNGSRPASGTASRITGPRVGLGSSGAGKSGLIARPGDHVVRAGAAEISRTSEGRVRNIRVSGMEIYHSAKGDRTVTKESADGTVAVANQHGGGYIAHPYDYHGNSSGWSGWQFVERTYSAKIGNPSNRVAFYQRYAYYNAIPLDVYAPRIFYSPGFYAWTYNPWAQPISYSWGWSDQPWYSYFGSYFSASPVYGSPALWLADYLLGETLQDGYQNRPAETDSEPPSVLAGDTVLGSGDARVVTTAPQPPFGSQQWTAAPQPDPVTPEVKADIANEVRQQIALENFESTGPSEPPDPASSGVERMVAENTPRVFVVSSPLDLSSGTAECSVTEGDVLQLNPGTPPGATANLVVMASRSGDCRKGMTVTVGLSDLQEMQNGMRQAIDDGLGRLRQSQGRDGLPSAPRSADQAPRTTEWAVVAPPATPSVDVKLGETNAEASALESPALKTAVKPAASVAPAELMGKTQDQIKAMLGTPRTVVDFGSKGIYVFEGRRITFTQGKVTDVQ
jgi:hypothetical protein